jgi:PAS domain S-box-containing protein
MKIRSQMLISYTAVALLPVMIAMAIAIYQTFHQTQDMQKKILLSSIETSAESLSTFFTERVTEMRLYATQPDVRAMNFEGMRPFLMSTLENKNGIYEKFIVGTDKGYFYNTAGGNPYQQGLRTFDDKDPGARKKHIRKRDYWQVTVGDNSAHQAMTYVSNPMISYTTGVKQVVVASTIEDDDRKVQGLIGGALPWQQVEKLIEDARQKLSKHYPADTRFMMVSNDGVYWYHWDENRVIHLRTNQQGEILKDEYGEKQAVISNILKEEVQALSSAGNQMILGRSGFKKLQLPMYDFSGYVFYAPVKVANYSIAALVSDDVVDAPTQYLANSFLWVILGTMLLISLFVWRISRSLSDPLTRLNRSIMRQAQTATLEEVTEEGPEELQSISRALNILSKQLSSSQQELTLSEQRFALAMDAANDGLWDWNIKTGHVYYSNRWKEMLGYGPHELSHSIAAWQELLHPEDNRQVENTLNAYLSGEQDSYDVSFRMKHKQGHWVHILARGLAINDPDTGEALRMVGTHTDISSRIAAELQLKELNAELENQVSEKTSELVKTNEALEQARDQALLSQQKAERANAAKSRFLANMSHEIRTPMNAIIGLTELCLQNQLNDQQRRKLSTVKDSADSLLNLINDILDFSKIEAGELTLEQMPFSLERLMHDVLAMLEIHSSESAVKLKLEMPESLPPCVNGDKLRLRQVLINLGTNAVKFTEQGTVTLSLKIAERTEESILVYFHVRDTGIGMNKQQADSIFGAFKQADSSTTRQYGGTGLGLSISQQIIQLMGSKIHLESIQGEGSHFFFKLNLPLDDNLAIEEPETLGVVPDHELSGRILLVEDSYINREIAIEIIEQSGSFDLDIAEDGEQAVSLARQQHYDLILMDIQMPVLDGIGATRMILSDSLNQETPIIALTANVMASDQKQYKQEGMKGHLSKPFHIDDLKKLLLHWL